MNVDYEQNNNLVENLVRKTQNISLNSHNNNNIIAVTRFKTTKGVLTNLENTRNELLQKYTNGFKDNIETENEGAELIHKIELITKHIETLQKSLPKPANSGYKITCMDLPGFQLKYQKDLPFPNKPQFESVTQFLRQFEKVLDAGGHNVIKVWKQFIPLTLSLDLDAWLTGDLLKCITWDKTKELFQKKFGNSFAKVEARRAVFNMRICANESTKEYYLRFTKSINEAGYNKNDTTLGEVYYNSLPINWQTQIGTLLITRGINEDKYTIDDITDVSNSIYGEKTPKDVLESVVIVVFESIESKHL